MMISSQRYIDIYIVDQKSSARDYTVTIATVSDDYQIAVDGHHAFAAARQDGVTPVFVEADYDYKQEFDFLGMDDFLCAHQNDSEWYDINTGIDIF